MPADPGASAPYRPAMEIVECLAAPPDRPSRVELEPGKMEQGLLKLVLTLVALIRQLMEKQAIRRIEAGSLTDEEVERLGKSLMELDSTIEQLRLRFGIDDLNIDLGPAGMLLDA